MPSPSAVLARAPQPQPRELRRRAQLRRLAAVFVATGALVALGPALRLVAVPEPDLPGGAGAVAAPGVEAAGPVGDIVGFMRSQLAPLEKQVDSGYLVPKFGEKAEGIVSAVVSRAVEAGPQFGRAVDGMLEALFLRQLLILRQQLAAKYDKASRPMEAVSQADSQFVVQAHELLRPGSSWSFDEDRYALRAVLEGAYRREAALTEEKAKASKTQQSTVEIISKLQSQVEALQQKVQNLRAGSPWFLSASWRIPKTPLQLVGRYQQGRANLELALSSDRDPANAEAGFVEGIGPANLGVTFNVGM